VLLAWIAIIAICSFESLFLTVPLFRALGMSGLESIGLGILFSFVMIGYCHMIPRLIAMGKTKTQRRIIFGVLLVLTVALFWFMAEARVRYLNGMMQSYGVNSGASYSPLLFTLTSLLLFSVATAISYFFLPNKEQTEKMEEYNKLQKDKVEADKKVEELKQKIDSLQADKNNFKNGNALQYLAASDIEDMIINNVEGFYPLYKRENLKHRSAPSPFTPEPNYPFSFKRHFKVQKSIQ
jgi:cell division protein FtsB